MPKSAQTADAYDLPTRRDAPVRSTPFIIYILQGVSIFVWGFALLASVLVFGLLVYIMIAGLTPAPTTPPPPGGTAPAGFLGGSGPASGALICLLGMPACLILFSLYVLAQATHRICQTLIQFVRDVHA